LAHPRLRRKNEAGSKSEAPSVPTPGRRGAWHMTSLVRRHSCYLGDRLTRRAAIRLGTIGLGGFPVADPFKLQALSEAGSWNRLGKARSVIILFLSGGPAHQDMWDLKPDAPEEVRGTFRPIDTDVPGIQISEHLPRMAQLAKQYAIVRSLHHRQSNHPAAAYW